MSRRPERPKVAVVVPDEAPVLSPVAARLLLAIVRGDVVEAPVVDLRIGRSPDEPEALAS